MGKRTFVSNLRKKVKTKLKTLSFAEIFIFVAISAFTIFLVKYFGLKREWRTIRIEVIKQNWTENFDPYGYRVPYWLSDKVHIGQTQKDKSGKVIATLVDFDSYDRGTEEDEMYLNVKVKVIHNKRTDEYLFNDKTYLNLGSPIELTLNNILIKGQIIDTNVPEKGYPIKYFQVITRGRNVEPWIISQISPNDKVINKSNNELIAKIIEIKTEDPSNQIASINGKKYLEITPNNRVRDILVTAKIKAYFQDGKWYFSGHQNAKVGNGLYFYTNKVNMFGFEIQDIKEISLNEFEQ